MAISGSGFNINPTPEPTIFHLQTTGQFEQKNAGDVRGNAVILPQSASDDVSFTKLDNRNKWDYKSESERPSLTPNTILRGSGPQIKNTDDGWRAQYEDLLNHLPDDVKLELAGLPTVYTAALKFVLDLAANALDSQSKALQMSQSENALARVNENAKLPEKAYQVALAFGDELTSVLERWIKAIGQNDPGYQENIEFLGDAKALLEGLSHVHPKNAPAA